MLKRQTPDTEDASDISSKKRKLEESTDALPADFFSRPRDASPSDAEMENENVQAEPTGGASAELELEYRRFQRELLTIPDPLEAYQSATVVAEAELVPEDSQRGFPAEDVAEAVTVDKQDERRRDEDEREMILDRLLDEERAQEDADMRVDLMKKRLEAAKRKRQQRVSAE